MRYNDWKVSFKTVEGNLFNGHEASTNAPLVTNLRQDPWERYQSESMLYGKWWGEKMWTFLPATTVVGQFLNPSRNTRRARPLELWRRQGAGGAGAGFPRRREVARRAKSLSTSRHGLDPRRDVPDFERLFAATVT